MHYTIDSKCDQFWMIYLTQRVNTFQSSDPLYIESVYSDGYKDGMLIMSPHVQDCSCLSQSLEMMGLTGSTNRFYANSDGPAV